jgi:hypothetical protein
MASRPSPCYPPEAAEEEEPLVQRVRPVQRVQQEEIPVLRAPREQLVQRVLPEPRVRQVPRVLPALEKPAQQELLVQPVQVVAQRVRLGQPERQERPGQRVLRERPVQERRALPVLQAQRARPVRPALREPRALRVTLVLREQRELRQIRVRQPMER